MSFGIMEIDVGLSSGIPSQRKEPLRTPFLTFQGISLLKAAVPVGC